MTLDKIPTFDEVKEWVNGSSISPNSIENTTGTYFEGISTNGSVSGTTTIDVSAANVFDHTVDGDVDYSFTGASSSVNGASFTLKITMSGSNAITWPTSVEWSGGSAPSAPADTKELEVSFITYDGGSTWKGRPSWVSG
jgi:hypothetical protein